MSRFCTMFEKMSYRTSPVSRYVLISSPFLFCFYPYFYQARKIQKQPPKCVLRKRCSENMQQIYGRTPMPKCVCNFTEIAAWVFSCKFAAFFQNTFQEHLYTAASEYFTVFHKSPLPMTDFSFKFSYLFWSLLKVRLKCFFGFHKAFYFAHSCFVGNYCVILFSSWLLSIVLYWRKAFDHLEHVFTWNRFI